jgi:ATP-dependent DNA helicase RecG
MPTAFASVDHAVEWAAPRGRPRPEALERTLDSVRGVGPKVQKRLAALGLRTVRDLLEHRPRRYEAAVPERRIVDLLAEEEVVVSGVVRRVSLRRPRRRLAIVSARIDDGSGEIRAVWFNQEWLADRLRAGSRIRLRGQLRRGEFHVRSYDLDGVESTADFAAVYPASEDITPRKLRELGGGAVPPPGH